MSLKSIAGLFAVSVMAAAPALAQPSLQWVDNGGTVTLQVDPDDAGGSVATEIAITASAGITFTDPLVTPIVVNDTMGVAFDTETPGNNPFTGGVTMGLLDDEVVSDNHIFASHGSAPFAASTGATAYLTIAYTGSGTISASGLLAQNGVNTTGLMEDIMIGGGPFDPADFNDDGKVDLLDLDILGTNFGMMGDQSMGDANGDGEVDLLDLDILGMNFGNMAMPSAAVPEPTAAILAVFAAIPLLGRRAA